MELVDVLVAGNDLVTPKPHRDNAHVICSTLKVKPTSVSCASLVSSPVFFIAPWRIGPALPHISPPNNPLRAVLSLPQQ
jgi:hypothetical protein